MKIAINGFGRIGRSFYRIVHNTSELDVVAINDLTPKDNLEYLLKYDSVYGKFEGGLDGVKVLSEKDPSKLPWGDLGIDVVIESTGFFTDRESAFGHIEAGAKKVIISAVGENCDADIILGVNQDIYNPDKHHIIANGSCTTNCAAPTIKVLHDNFDVLRAQLITVHAVTSTQNIVDGAKPKKHRKGRAAYTSIIPTTTGAGIGTLKVIPELEGKLLASAFRVPVLCGSVLEIVAQVEKETNTEEVNSVFEKEADGRLKGILEVTHEELISYDVLGTTVSVIVDAALTEVINFEGLDGSMVKVVAWYDNEWAYSCRLADLCKLVVT